MTQTISELRNANWKRIGATSLLFGVTMAVFIIGMAAAMTWIGRALGWPEQMIRVGANGAVLAASLPFIFAAVRPTIRLLRGDDDNETRHAFTTEEIYVRTNGVRRRHYIYQVVKAGVVGLASVAGAWNCYQLLTRPDVFMPTFVEAFGSSARLNLQAITVMMGVLAVGGAAYAVYTWRNRYGDEKEQVYRAVEELDEEASRE